MPDVAPAAWPSAFDCLQVRSSSPASAVARTAGLCLVQINRLPSMVNADSITLAVRTRRDCWRGLASLVA
jgi:hypothetical protein